MGRKVPLRVVEVDRVPAARYYDQTFFDLECEHLWPRVWQMACRLDEIPNVGDFVEYENLGTSVIVVRTTTGDGGVSAYYNACRHRGLQIVQDRGCAKSGFICPFHGWCYGLDGENTFVFSPELFRPENLEQSDLSLRPCRVATWGGSAFINHDPDAAPLRDSLGPFAPAMEAFGVENMQVEWWESSILPVNWRLAIGTFLEGYHVRTTHPELVPPGSRGDASYKPSRPDGGSADSRAQVDDFLHYLRALGEGMGGMVHEREIQIAESLREVELPDPVTASSDFNQRVYEALTAWGEESGVPVPDFDFITEQGIKSGVWFAFPHFFLLPVYASASAYRVRPLGPEETLFEIWSLTPGAPGEERPAPVTPVPMAGDDERWPLIPAQDFSNLPRQQRGLHAPGFDYMRLAQGVEGSISNFERLVDGYLAGLDPQQLLEATKYVSRRVGTEITQDMGL